MTRLAIQGIGVVGGFGCGVAALEQRLEAGFTSPAELLVPVGGEELRLPAFLAETTPLERFLGKRLLRRIDHFSRLALLGAHLALEDADLLENPGERLGVVIATGYGAMTTTFSFLDTVLEDGDGCASPTHFANSVHNSAAAHVAIQLKATGPSLTVSQFEMSVASALLTVRHWLGRGRVDRVLLGAVDEVGGVLGYCWDRFFPGPSRRIEPFALERQSAVPGEGAAFFLLSRDREARYGQISLVSQGRTEAAPVAGTTWLLNADGHRRCSGPYRDLLTGPVRVAAYTPHFGSLPTGQAFDLAVAALAARAGSLPPGTGPDQLPEGWQPAAGRPIAGPVSCLKTDGHGNYGLIAVERS